tara:strand:- start:3811 stop:4455 length:645 start_codon:yes stop_codon:yes gene_type:complete
MTKNEKIAIGVGVALLVFYFVYKSRPKKKIDDSIESQDEGPEPPNDLSVDVDEGKPMEIDLEKVNNFAGYSNVSGFPFTFKLDSSPQNGTATLNNNLLVYTPNTGFDGVDEVLYYIEDKDGLRSSNAKITFNVSNVVYSGPTPQDLIFQTDESTPITTPLDVDANGVIVTGSSQGTSAPTGRGGGSSSSAPTGGGGRSNTNAVDNLLAGNTNKG